MEIEAALEAIRTERKPTRRGIMLCTDMMGKMLKFGWPKEDLDSLEILYWMTRDGNGELLPGTSVGRANEEHLVDRVPENADSAAAVFQQREREQDLK